MNKVYILESIYEYLSANWYYASDKSIDLGQSGIALFFFNYARIFKSEAAFSSAVDIFLDVYRNTVKKNKSNMIYDATGMGCFLIYTIKNGFIEADIDEALVNIDDIISPEIQHKLSNPYHHDYNVINHCYYFLERFNYASDVSRKLIIHDILISGIDELEMVYNTILEEKEKRKFLPLWNGREMKQFKLITFSKMLVLLNRITKFKIFPYKTSQLIISVSENIKDYIYDPFFESKYYNISEQYRAMITGAYSLMEINAMDPKDFEKLLQQKIIAFNLVDLKTLIYCHKLFSLVLKKNSSDVISLLLHKVDREIEDRASSLKFNDKQYINNYGILNGASGIGLAYLEIMSNGEINNWENILFFYR